MLPLSRSAVAQHPEVSAVLATSAVFFVALLAMGWAIV